MTVVNFIKFNDCIGRYTLLYGNTDTKKTYYTAKFIQYLLESKNYEPKDITILDFAPKLTYIKNLKIGGRIKDYYEPSLGCNYLEFEGEILPPRLKAKNKKELLEFICHNYKITSSIIQNFNENLTSILIINDISIYLHLGSRKYLLDTIKKSKTFFGNSYYGSKIKSKISRLLSLKERYDVEFFIKNIKNSYLTNSNHK